MSRERKEQMWEQALKLARSGYYNGWWSIEKKLQELGFSAAKTWLDEEGRERLDKLCAEARYGGDDA